jgi:uncharacterized protein YqeY
MGSAIKDRLNDSIKDAMRAKDKDRLTVLRMATSALKQIEVDERIELDDTRVLTVLEKLVKQRRESIDQFRKGGREDLAEREQAEITILQEFLPEALSEAEVDAIIREAIAATGASSAKDMGKVVGAVKPRVQGRADMGAVSQKIKALLG